MQGMYEETVMFRRIVALLDGSPGSVPYERFEHEYVHHSADAAKVRGTMLEEAAKAIVLECGSGRIVMGVVAGHRRLDLKTLKALLGEKDLHLAHPDKVLEATGCAVGSVPPFGNLFTPPMPVYCDSELFSREHIVFSAGSHYHSIRMLAKDWERIVAPTVAGIGKDIGAPIPQSPS